MMSIIGFCLMLASGVIRAFNTTYFGNSYYESPSSWQKITTWVGNFFDSLRLTVGMDTWSSDFSYLMLSGFYIFLVGL